jgi:hypothetical protein
MVAASAFAAGCNDVCFAGGHVEQMRVCEAGGMVTMSGLSAGDVTELPHVDQGNTCLDADSGTCSARPSLLITTGGSVDPLKHNFGVYFNFAPMQGAAAFTLPSSSVSVTGWLEANSADKVVVSGTVEVQSSTPEALVVGFDLHLQSDSGVMLGLTGRATINDCHTEGTCVD